MWKMSRSANEHRQKTLHWQRWASMNHERYILTPNLSFAYLVSAIKALITTRVSNTFEYYWPGGCTLPKSKKLSMFIRKLLSHKYRGKKSNFTSHITSWPFIRWLLLGSRSKTEASLSEPLGQICLIDRKKRKLWKEGTHLKIRRVYFQSQISTKCAKLQKKIELFLYF